MVAWVVDIFLDFFVLQVWVFYRKKRDRYDEKDCDILNLFSHFFKGAAHSSRLLI